MTTQLTFIDDYFTGSLSAEERADFEKKLQSDPAFADEVGFYLSSMAVSRESGGQEKKQRFKALYNIKGDETTARVIKFQWLRPAMSAAALLLIAFMAWTFFLKAPSSVQLANHYIKENFTSLGVKMGTSNKVEEAKNLYNQGKYSDALPILENILKEKPGDADILKLSGIVSLRLENYDKALGYFKWLADQQGLYDNPGTFYEALTLMKRNLPDDQQKAKILLQEVVNKNLSGREDAEEWLKQL